MPRVRLSLCIAMLTLVAGTHVPTLSVAAPAGTVPAQMQLQIDHARQAADLVAKPSTPEHLRAFIYAFQNRLGHNDLDLVVKGMSTVKLPSELANPQFLSLIYYKSLNPKIFLPDRPTDEDEHLETVKLIGSVGACTGTIVSHHSVLTAAHCGCGLGTGVKVYVGDPVDNRSVDVVDRTIHNLDCAKYQAASTAQKMDLLRVAGDVALLHTSQDLTALGVAPANPHGAYSSGSSYYIVGYGRTNKLSSLPKWVGTIIASDCGADASALGCNSELEFKGVGKVVSAGGLSTDICEGDSGGPVFVSDTSSPPKLTAVASRSYANAPADAACGHGALYVRIDSLLATWVTSNSR